VPRKSTAVAVSAKENTRLPKRNKGKLSATLLRPDIGAEDSDFARDREDFRCYPQVFDPWQP